MNATTWILWVFLANGNVVTQEYVTFEACHETQRIIQQDAQIRGSRAIERMLCIPGDERGRRAGVQ